MMEIKKYDLIVIGCGPAGLMGALTAAQNGAKVLICERLERCGMRLLASGSGKCNLTNVLSPDMLALRFGREWRFMMPALDLLPPLALRRWFEERQVPLKITDGFHVFPKSERAMDILNALLLECERHQVEIRTAAMVEKLLLKDGSLDGVRLVDGTAIRSSHVLVASGGKSYRSLGGNESGYRLAEDIGHEVVKPFPGLVGLQCEETWTGTLSGIVIAQVESTLIAGRQKLKCQGELLFTHQGISGPAVLDISGAVAAQIEAEQASVELNLNFTPDCDLDKWNNRIAQWRRTDGKKSLRRSLNNHFPLALVDIFLSVNQIDPERKNAEITAAEQKNLISSVLAMPLKIKSTSGWERAMVTHGGVALKKIDSKRGESKLLPGVYFAGEVVNLDGPCGGYNLQWAFSSGFLAGTMIAQDLKSARIK